MVKQVNVLIGAVVVTALCAITTLAIVCYQMFQVTAEVDTLNAKYLRDTETLERNIESLGAKMDRMIQHKCQVKYITPVKFQAKRGTCWDFTTLGILEQTYRRQGAEKGWLAQLEYVVFSEHAYGVAVIEYCRSNEGHCPHVRMQSNSTDGGFISWIYFFQPLQNKIVPNSVCPYVEDPTNDHECQDFHPYLKVNPLKFSVRNMRTMYDIAVIKEHLRINKNAMAWVSILGTVTYYVPCVGSFANTSACNETKCTHCPLDLAYPTKCCVKESRAGWNLDGEFYMHREMEEVGAHAMTLVGYNDNFVSKEGHRGGFIVKNSWGAWHSHTLQYFLHEMSPINEAEICPNSRNPRNWVPGHTVLVCSDLHYCDDKILYELVSVTDGPDGTVVMCFDRRNSSMSDLDSAISRALSGDSSHECSPPMPLDLYADFFEPISDQIEPNDEDACGYFFFPYAVTEEINKKFGFFWVSDFDIEWDPQSYFANRNRYPQLDYSQIIASTTKAYLPNYPDALPFFPPEDDDPHSGHRFFAVGAGLTAKPAKSKGVRRHH